MSTRGLDRVEEPVPIGMRVPVRRGGEIGESSPPRFDRRQRKGPGTHQDGGIAAMIMRLGHHQTDDTEVPGSIDRGRLDRFTSDTGSK